MTVAGRAYRADTRLNALAEYYRMELRACGCPITANERVADYAKRLDTLQPSAALMNIDQAESLLPRRIVVDGRDAAVVEIWADHEDGSSGYDYRFDGELATHWIRHSSPRLGRREP